MLPVHFGRVKRGIRKKTRTFLPILMGMALLMLIWSCSPKAIPTTSRRPSPKKSPYEEVVKLARSYLGTPYRYGGMDRNGVDCSGLVCRVYLDAAGISLPRTAYDQALIGEPVKKEDLRPGDLVFFKEPHAARITHVGIVSAVEGGKVRFIHAASGRRRVVEDDLDHPHWKARYMGARRPIIPSKADAHTDPPEKLAP